MMRICLKLQNGYFIHGCHSFVRIGLKAAKCEVSVLPVNPCTGRAGAHVIKYAFSIFCTIQLTIEMLVGFEIF